MGVRDDDMELNKMNGHNDSDKHYDEYSTHKVQPITDPVKQVSNQSINHSNQSVDLSSDAPIKDSESGEQRRDRLLQIYLPKHGMTRWLIVNSLKWIVVLELFLYMLPVFINYGVAPDLYQSTVSASNKAGAIFVFAFAHFWSLLAILSATFVLVFELSHHVVIPSHLVSMYFAIVVHYGSWYQLIYACNTSSMVIIDQDTSTDLANRMILFIYLSICIQSTAGLGDAYPSMWYGKAIAMSQMVLSLLYTTGMFGIGLDHFRAVLDDRKSVNYVEPTYFWTRYINRLTTDHPVAPKVWKFILRFILPLSITIQLVQLGLLVAAFGHNGHIFGEGDQSKAADGTGVVNFLCLFFQFLQFIIVVVSSCQIIFAPDAKELTLSFIIQSYIALLCLFGGLFLTIYLFVGVDGFFFAEAGFNAEDQSIFKTFGELLWLSFEVMATLGFGDCGPVHTAARIFVGLEMALSPVYAIVILGIAMTRITEFWKDNRIALPALPSEEAI